MEAWMHGGMEQRPKAGRGNKNYFFLRQRVHFPSAKDTFRYNSTPFCWLKDKGGWEAKTRSPWTRTGSWSWRCLLFVVVLPCHSVVVQTPFLLFFSCQRYCVCIYFLYKYIWLGLASTPMLLFFLPQDIRNRTGQDRARHFSHRIFYFATTTTTTTGEGLE